MNQGISIMLPVCSPQLVPVFRTSLGQSIMLHEDYHVHYTRPDGKICSFSVPKRFEFEASIPNNMVIRALIGSPFDPKFWAASSVHDFCFVTNYCTKEEADRAFLELLRRSRVPEKKAWIMYLAVKHFGNKAWEQSAEEVKYLVILEEYLNQRGKSLTDYKPIIPKP